MRLNVAGLRRLIKGKLHVEFMPQELTLYSGLELLRRYLRQRDLSRRLQAACAKTSGDYGGGRLALRSVLGRLEAEGVRVYRTDRDGAVVLEASGVVERLDLDPERGA
jgi:hypothetical protein